MTFTVQTLTALMHDAARDLGIHDPRYRPDLIRTGIDAFDNAVGGFLPGETGVLAGFTGVGKTSVMQHAAKHSTARTGIVVLEDSPLTIGTRELAARTGINSMGFRKNDLTADQRVRAHDALAETPSLDDVRVVCARGLVSSQIGGAVRALVDDGCRMLWFDYITRIPNGGGERRHEIAHAFRVFQDAVATHNAAGIAVSQLRRPSTDDAKPSIYMLKESGELENDARFIFLAHRERGSSRLTVDVAKSHAGGEGTVQHYDRENGVLVPVAAPTPRESKPKPRPRRTVEDVMRACGVEGY